MTMTPVQAALVMDMVVEDKSAAVARRSDFTPVNDVDVRYLSDVLNRSREEMVRDAVLRQHVESVVASAGNNADKGLASFVVTELNLGTVRQALPAGYVFEKAQAPVASRGV